MNTINDIMIYDVGRLNSLYTFGTSVVYLHTDNVVFEIAVLIKFFTYCHRNEFFGSGVQYSDVEVPFAMPLKFK